MQMAWVAILTLIDLISSNITSLRFLALLFFQSVSHIYPEVPSDYAASPTEIKELNTTALLPLFLHFPLQFVLKYALDGLVRVWKIFKRSVTPFFDLASSEFL